MDQFRPKITICRMMAVLMVICASGCATRGPAPLPIARHAVPVSSTRNIPPLTKQQKLAFDRYAMLARIEETHLFYLGTMPGGYSETAAFPAGRADRIYLLYGYSVICYQHKNGKDKRVYKIVFQDKSRAVTNDRPVVTRQIHSLFDYITKETEFQTPTGDKRAWYYALPKGTSEFAKRDLATEGRYVEYSSDVMNDILTVSLINDENNGKYASTVDYDPSLDPFTRAPIPDFYQRYGLPVIPVEAAILDHRPLR